MLAYFLADEIRDELEEFVINQKSCNTIDIQVFLKIIDDFTDTVFDFIEEENSELQKNCY